MRRCDESRPGCRMPRPRHSRLKAPTPAGNSGLPKPAPHDHAALEGEARHIAEPTCSSFLESSSERMPAISEAGAAGCRSALRTQLLSGCPGTPPRFTATSESHLPASPLGGRCASKHAPPPEKKWRSSTGNWKDVEVVTTVLIRTSDGDATGHGIGNSSTYEVNLRTVTKISARTSIATSSSSNSSKIRQQQQQQRRRRQQQQQWY